MKSARRWVICPKLGRLFASKDYPFHYQRFLMEADCPSRVFWLLWWDVSIEWVGLCVLNGLDTLDGPHPRKNRPAPHAQQPLEVTALWRFWSLRERNHLESPHPVTAGVALGWQGTPTKTGVRVNECAPFLDEQHVANTRCKHVKTLLHTWRQKSSKYWLEHETK